MGGDGAAGVTLLVWFGQGNVAMLVATCCIVGPRKVTPLHDSVLLGTARRPDPGWRASGQQMRSMGQPKRIITSLVFVGEPLALTEVASLLWHTEI